MLFSLKITVFTVFSGRIQNPMVSVWYYQMHFFSNVETQVGIKFKNSNHKKMHHRNSCGDEVRLWCNFPSTFPRPAKPLQVLPKLWKRSLKCEVLMTIPGKQLLKKSIFTCYLITRELEIGGTVRTIPLVFSHLIIHSIFTCYLITRELEIGGTVCTIPLVYSHRIIYPRKIVIRKLLRNR